MAPSYRCWKRRIGKRNEVWLTIFTFAIYASSQHPGKSKAEADVLGNPKGHRRQRRRRGEDGRPAPREGVFDDLNPSDWQGRDQDEKTRDSILENLVARFRDLKLPLILQLLNENNWNIQVIVPKLVMQRRNNLAEKLYLEFPVCDDSMFHAYS